MSQQPPPPSPDGAASVSNSQVGLIAEGSQCVYVLPWPLSPSRCW